jgi:hypothetical protein
MADGTCLFHYFNVASPMNKDLESIRDDNKRPTGPEPDDFNFFNKNNLEEKKIEEEKEGEQ